MSSHSPTSRSRIAAFGAGLLLVLAACGGTAGTAGLAGSDGMNGMGGMGGHGQSGWLQPPIHTSDADWKGVAQTLGRTGTLMGGTVYRVPLPRNDLTVTSQGVSIKPGLSLGGYAAFAKYRDGTMLMGDLVVTETELPKVTDALQAAGIAQTALHKHLLAQHPDIWWTHVQAMGDPVKIATGVKAALAQTGIPPASPPPPPQPPIDLNTAGIDKAIGRKGTADGGIYKFTIARKDTIDDGARILPPAFGITTGINFQPLGAGKTAINGDFVLTAPETQEVIQALRKGGIDIVELHNHMQDENPRLFFMHFWATGDGLTLAKALRPALNATNLTSPTS
jgi:hypothetical protein